MAEVKGLAELHAMLRKLPQALQENVAIGALRAGADVVAKQAREDAPVRTPNQRNRKKYGLYAGALRDTIRVTQGSVANGVARVSVLAGGGGRGKAGWNAVFYARMVEFGTRPHWIMVREDKRPTRMTRRGVVKPYSIRTLNKMTASGSLKIGENFVGASVAHPGARPKPFMRPALEKKAQEAVQAMAAYVRKRCASKKLREFINEASVQLKEAA